MIHNIKDRFRRFISAAVVDGLNDHGLFKNPAQNKPRTIDEQIRFNAGTVLSSINEFKEHDRPHKAGYRVFSQFDEDGILEYLIRNIDCPHKTFVEIGVEDYRESNTRYLLERHYWSGVAVDAGPELEDWLNRSSLRYFHDIRPMQCFVTAENINEILRESFTQIDVLSIDIDGNDYHIWKSIDFIKPNIVIIEFNPLFGQELNVTTPYDPKFNRSQYHFSKSCFGASLGALISLAEAKGYSLVETSFGPNAFFVKNECLGKLKPLSIQEAWKNYSISEVYTEAGEVNYHASVSDIYRIVQDCRVLDLTTNQEVTLKELVAEL